MRSLLVVHATKSSPTRIERDAALSDSRIDTASRKFIATPSAREEAAFVNHGFDFDQVGALQWKLDEFHWMTSTVGIGTTKRPPHSRTCDICSRISSRKFHG